MSTALLPSCTGEVTEMAVLGYSLAAASRIQYAGMFSKNFSSKLPLRTNSVPFPVPVHAFSGGSIHIRRFS